MVEEFDIDTDIQEFCHSLNDAMGKAVNSLGLDKALLFLRAFTENYLAHHEGFFDDEAG